MHLGIKNFVLRSPCTIFVPIMSSQEPTTTYKSKVDLWLILVIFGTIAVSVIPTLLFSWYYTAALTAVLILIVAPPIFGTRYKITGNTLTVKCGYFPAGNHDISLIATIKPTRTILSAPASSLDRIEIRFVNHSSVVISPYDKLKFINHLRSINPDIDISSFRQK